MRSEKEMFDLILGVAKQDERIRAVYMNGSRANPNAKKDIFQDYDIVYVVKETASFIANPEWKTIFGDPIIFQEPDRLDRSRGMDINYDEGYTYLMQFTDGNRIDLHLEPVEIMKESYKADGLTVPLLDKDHCLPNIQPPTDKKHWVKKPSYADYYCTCNNFWWVAPYCAKGLWRKEILYTIEVMNSHVRQELLTMLSWRAGIEKDFKISVGKAHKYLKQYMQDEEWERLMQSFNMGSYESAWEALLVTCELFEKVALEVGEKLGYEYNTEEAHRSFKFIKHIKNLPEDAKEIY